VREGRDSFAEPTIVKMVNSSYFAIDSKGRVFSWGSNTEGQLGHGDKSDLKQPKVIRDLQGIEVSQIVHQNGVCAAVSSTGELFQWGGDNLSLVPSKFDQVPGKVVEVAITCWADRNKFWILTEDGFIYQNVGKDIQLFDALSGEAIISVKAGREHVVFLSSSGSVYTLGNPESGRLGTGFNEGTKQVSVLAAQNCTPVSMIIPFLSDVVAIDANHKGSAALCSDGAVYSWGNGKAFPMKVPFPVPISRVFVAQNSMVLGKPADDQHPIPTRRFIDQTRRPKAAFVMKMDKPVLYQGTQTKIQVTYPSRSGLCELNCYVRDPITQKVTSCPLKMPDEDSNTSGDVIVVDCVIECQDHWRI
jgi:alpha-tubulin suppressor-like RCC1 family protein